MKKLLVTAAAGGLLLGGANLALAAPGPNGHNDYGLCTAYFAGSENGQEHKHSAPPFAALEAAAEESNQTVEEFCASATPGGK